MVSTKQVTIIVLKLSSVRAYRREVTGCVRAYGREVVLTPRPWLAFRSTCKEAWTRWGWVHELRTLVLSLQMASMSSYMGTRGNGRYDRVARMEMTTHSERPKSSVEGSSTLTVDGDCVVDSCSEGDFNDYGCSI